MKLALLRGHGSHSLQIFTNGSGSGCLTYVPLGGPPPKKNLGGFFPNPLGQGAWSEIFLAIVPKKMYPKLVSKFWGLPPKKFEGGQSLEISILKLAVLRGHGSHSLQIFQVVVGHDV